MALQDRLVLVGGEGGMCHVDDHVVCIGLMAYIGRID